MTGLADALVKAQAEMPPVPKTKEVEVTTKTGGKYTYKYATLDALIAATLPVLNRHGLAMVQLPAQTDSGMPGLRTIIVHGESGEELSATTPLSVGQGMQELGSAITFMRRYAWAAALGIASEHDDDGAHASNGSSHTPAAAQAVHDAQPSQSSLAPSTITEPQRKRLFAIAKAKNVDDATVKRLVKEVAGVESSSEVSKAKYDALVAAVEMAGVKGGFVDESDVPFAPTMDAVL